jgi:CRISPR-associated protein Csd1
MVRDWMEGSFEELARNVVEWFEHLEIVALDGLGPAPRPKLAALLAALFKPGESFGDRRLAHLEVALWRAAVAGASLPREILAQAVDRARMDVVDGQAPHPVRMALIKACLLRKEQGGMKVSPNLYPEHPEPAYHCGRLLAVLSSLQYAALGEVGAGVVQRYYGAASTTPARVLGRLIGLSNHHLGKVAGEGRPRLARWFENQIAEIMGSLKDTIPRTLTLDQQGLFALGYYQQLAHMRSKKTQEDPDAPAGEQA